MDKKTEKPGGKQYMIEQVRKSNDGNFQSFYGSDAVTYNRKDTIEQAQHQYFSFHDGFSLHEDDFIHNGITIADGPGKRATVEEKVNLTHLLTENLETLRQGTEEQLNIALLEGSQSVSAYDIPGLDEMIPIVPGANTYAGILRSNAYWQTNVGLNATQDQNAVTGIEAVMRKAWRDCVKYGGRPDKIIAGATFIDKLTGTMLKNYGRVDYGAVSNKAVEGASSILTFEGVPVVWDPTFEGATLNDNDSQAWTDRCYFINSKQMKLCPIKSQWMLTRNPPRVYNKYEYYWGLTSRFYIKSGRPSAHGVVTFA
jgi:hypothetical protein